LITDFKGKGFSRNQCRRHQKSRLTECSQIGIVKISITNTLSIKGMALPSISTSD